MLLLQALRCFLTPSRRPWYQRYADYVSKHAPDHKSTLLDLFDRKRVFSYRYNILITPWVKIGVHNIIHHDEPMMHTHDWSFASYMLGGGYWEHTEEAGRCFRPPGSFLFRHFSFKHFIEVGKEPAWTLLIALKKQNVHQFMVPCFGLVRWDVLLFNYMIDTFRNDLTDVERRYLMSQEAGSRAPRP